MFVFRKLYVICYNVKIKILGLTPLHLAVQDGNRKMAKMLLDSGADINAVVSKISPTSLSTKIILFSSSFKYYVHYFFLVLSSFWVIHLIRCPKYHYLSELNTWITLCHHYCRKYSNRWISVWSVLFSFTTQDIKSGRSPLIHAVEKSCMEMISFLVEVWLYLSVCFCFICFVSFQLYFLNSYCLGFTI